MFLKRRVRWNFHREMRQNRESSYALLLLVLTLPVVRGSCFSTGVPAVIFNREMHENRESVHSLFSFFVLFPLFAVHGISP